jgi:phage tail P2-like protein
MSLLPPNATNLEKALEAAVQAPPLTVPLRELWNPDTCPSNLLPWLAWQLAVTIWDSAWSDDTKRQRIRDSISDHRRKGTVASVQKELDDMGGHVTLSEWFNQDPPGDPYTFELALTVDDPAVPKTAGYVESVLDRISRVKPVRAHGIFKQSFSAAGGVGFDATARPALFLRLEAQSPAKDLTYLTGADGAQLVNGFGNLFVEA